MSEITEEPGAPGPICKIGTLSSVSPDPGVRHFFRCCFTGGRDGGRGEKEKEKKRKEEGKKEHREVERWGTQPEKRTGQPECLDQVWLELE